MNSNEENKTAPIDEAAVLESVGLLQAGQAFYNEPAAADELNLVRELRDRLFEQGVDEETLGRCFDGNNFVQEAVGKHTHAQQWNLTRWLDEQFTLVQVQDGTDTRLYRYQAMYEVTPEAWLKVLDGGILPNLTEFGIRERK